jgi:hypothetical protein
MAQTAEDWDVYGNGISDDLPFHYGSHPQWDAKAKGIISNDYENILIKKYISIDKIPDNILIQSLTKIEEDLVLELKKIGVTKLK